MSGGNLPLVWIDGATGTLGRAVVQAFIDQGWKTLSLLRPESEAGELSPVVRFPETTSGTLKPPLNGLKTFLKDWIAQFGPPAAFVSCSGFTHNGLAARTSASTLRQLLEANLVHQTRIVRALLPWMFHTGSGAIVLCSSHAASHPQTGQADYAASKAALESWVRGVAIEVGSKGVRINAVAPGWVDSPMVRELSTERQQALLNKIPLGRFATPEEVAAAFTFLAGDASSYLTGQVIQINGGAG